MEQDLGNQKQRGKAKRKDIDPFVHGNIALLNKVKRYQQQNATGAVQYGIQFRQINNK